MHEIVQAQCLAAPVPPDLSAICFFRRPTAGKSIRVYAVGDIGFSGKLGDTAKRKGFSALFGQIANLLRTGDVVFGNLETPLIDKPHSNSLFAGSPFGAAALKKSGFTLLHLANNHINDYGRDGLTSTLNSLRRYQIMPLGAGESIEIARRTVRTNIGGILIGWLGCGRTGQNQADNGPHFWEFSETGLVESVRKVRDTVNVLIVSIHIGYMYLDYPHPDHKTIAERLVSEGADLVLMHHAHVLQGVEVIGEDSIICYNLGNFLLDWEEGNVKANVMVKEQKQGAVFMFDIDRKGICRAAALPTYIDDEYCVRWGRDEKSLGIIERLCRISENLKGDFGPKFVRQRIERNVGLSVAVFLFHLKKRNWRIIANILKETRFEHYRMLLQGLAEFLLKPFSKIF